MNNSPTQRTSQEVINDMRENFRQWNAGEITEKQRQNKGVKLMLEYLEFAGFFISRKRMREVLGNDW